MTRNRKVSLWQLHARNRRFMLLHDSLMSSEIQSERILKFCLPMGLFEIAIVSVKLYFPINDKTRVTFLGTIREEW